MSGDTPLFGRKLVTTSVLNMLGQFGSEREKQAKDFIENMVGDVIRYARISGQCSRYSVAGRGSVLTFEAKSSLHVVHGRVSDVSGYVDACFEDDGSLSIEPPPKMHVEFPVERLRSGNDIQDREMWRLIDSKRFPVVSADLRDLKPTSVAGPV